MALHRFEEQAGKKLRERQITPSAGSWEKLEANLGRDEKKKNFRIWWPLVAALLVLAFLAGNLFFRTTPGSPDIVEEPTKKGPENSPVIEEFIEPVELASEGKETKAGQPEAIASTGETPQKKGEDKTRKELVVASAEVENLHFGLKNINNEPSFQETAIEENDLEEAITMVVSEQAEKDLTDAEVDALLLEAANQLTRKQTFNKNGSVNAAALLADVETELDHSFRKKIFELLKEGFEEASYAFSNRNK
ncbi:hypothetical protein [Salegentibacter sp. F14]